MGAPQGRRARWPRVPQVPFMSLYLSPRGSSLGHCHTPPPVDWMLAATAAGHGRVARQLSSSPETGWTEPSRLPAGHLGVLGQRHGPRCRLALPECRLRFPAQRQRVGTAEAGWLWVPVSRTWPCVHEGCRDAGRSGDFASPAAVLGMPASVGRVAVDTVVGIGAASCPVSRPERAAGSASHSLGRPSEPQDLTFLP